MQGRRSRWPEANKMIQQTFGADDRFWEIVQYRQEGLI